jgi:glycosyltransferase involved in cell wall biosynthesis
MGKKSKKYSALVSLILPIYNINEEYLEKCVKSIMSQTYKNIEIILVDDGSKNNSLKVCNNLASEDSRIVVYHQENSGVSIARNKGIEISRGEYICFIDPDDWIVENYVEKLLDSIVNTKADFAICNCIVHYSSYDVSNDFLNYKVNNKNMCCLSLENKNDLLYQLIGKKICNYYPPEVAAGVPWGKIFDKRFIEKYKLRFVPKMARMQDNIFCLYAIEYAEKICYLNERLYFYRKEIGSICYKYSPKIVEYFQKYFIETLIFLNTFNKEKKLYKSLYMKELTSFNSYLSQYYFNKSNQKKYKIIKQELNSLLKKDIYAEAIKNIDYSLLNFQEKIFVFLLKKRLYILLFILIKIRNIKKM